MKRPCVYVMANKRNGTLILRCDVRSCAVAAHQHRTAAVDGFTKRYGCKLLVWYELHQRVDEAIAREKQIKGGSRAKKLALIEAMNPVLA